MSRYARLTTVRWGPEPTDEPDVVASNARQVAEMIDRAAQDGSDLIVMPEIIAHWGIPREAALDFAQTVPGPFTDTVGEACRRNSCYAVTSLYEEHGGRCYNSAVLIGRDGKVVGVYRKYRPTIGEIERGITPGTELPVFQTDFGRVGMAICFDMNFLDVGQGLYANKVQCLCWPAMDEVGLGVHAWALFFETYLVSSWGGQINKIIDMTGETVAKTGFQYWLVTAEVNFDRVVLHQDANMAMWDAIRAKYREGVDIRIAHPEAIFTLASNMDDVSAMDIVEEFGMETRRDYLARAMRTRDEAVENAFGRQ